MTQSFYSLEILKFIDADNCYFDTMTPAKFSIAGNYCADLAQCLDYSSDRWLRNWLNESYGENKACEVESDWEDWLLSRTQQSVSVNFLNKYQLTYNSGNNYPDERKSWHKEIEQRDTNLEQDVSNLITIAHAEDIELWSSEIVDLIDNSFVTFDWLKTRLDLTPAQIYLGIILSDRFTLTRSEDDFYGGFSISISEMSFMKIFQYRFI